jgi:hypothetical protein
LKKSKPTLQTIVQKRKVRAIGHGTKVFCLALLKGISCDRSGTKKPKFGMEVQSIELRDQQRDEQRDELLPARRTSQPGTVSWLARSKHYRRASLEHQLEANPRFSR